MQDLSFIQDYPIKINLYGCQGDIYRLRSSGWRIATRCDYIAERCAYVLQICGEHLETKCRLLSEAFEFDTRYGYNMNLIDIIQNVELHCQTMAGTIFIKGQDNSLKYENWNVFTAPYPNLIVDTNHNFDPHNIPFFSKGNPDSEIIIPDKSVDELLKEILDKQEVLQSEFREKRLSQKRKAEQGNLDNDNIIQLPIVKKRIELLAI